MPYPHSVLPSLKPVKNQLLTTCSLALLAAALSNPVFPQETSSAVRGIVSDWKGKPISGSTVIVRNGDTGLARTGSTNEKGEFSFRNLPVGDDYAVSVTGAGYSGRTMEHLSLNLGRTTDLNFTLLSSDQVEEVLVVAEAPVVSQVAVGPGATFSLEQLETSPAINRNIADVLRADARIYVDESRGDINAVQCGGKNSRFNSLTVDGVRMNDSFGLNSNGYPTERMPFSYDAISQVSVELAPFDVEYGGFTACNINAVTKSGGSRFGGSLFFDYTSNELRGDSLEGDAIKTGDYDEKRYGLNIGGPVIANRLFFFAAYEKLEGANLFDRGPAGSGAVNEIDVSREELDEILAIARDRYRYDPGTIPAGMDNEDEKFLVKLDWHMSDTQRLSVTWNYNDGHNFVQSDGDNDEFEFSNHLYERGAELNSWAATLYSDWTDNFSTEFRLGYLDLDNRQISVGGTDFGEIRVELDAVDVYLGGDDSRQANKLDYDVLTAALKAKYDLYGHQFTFGLETESLDVFNMFVQHTETELRFRGIENFRNGYASAIYYNNAPSNDPADAAADWGYALHTVYAQDEFRLGDRLTVVAGLRYDWYSTGDSPEENAQFVADYGFTNATNLDGEGLLQPRFAFTWEHSGVLTVRGGAGLYTGGNPNVWLSNNYSANNVLQFGQRGRSFGYTDGSRSLFDADVVYLGLEEGVPAGPGYGIPAELYDAVAGGMGDNFEINYLDPDFDLPAEWKFALGATWHTESDYVLTADLLYTLGQDSAIVKRGDLEQAGATAEGYPIYNSVREPSFVLTNSSKGNRSFVAFFSVSRAYENGFDWTLGYSWTDAEDVQPMTSSVAFSNYRNRAFFDPQEEVLSTSNYTIAHRITATAGWERAFFGDNLTRISLYGSMNEGAPYSYAFDGTIDPYNFTPYLDFRNNVLAPGDKRNANAGSWWEKIDLRIEQQLPGFVKGSKASAFLVIDNLTNLLNDDWGILRQVNFPGNVERGAEPESRRGDASRFEVRAGIKYTF